MEAMAADYADPRRAREFALLLGEGAKFPRLMARYTETVVEPRREVIRSVLRRGVASGELRPDVDVEVALFMLTGAVHRPGASTSPRGSPPATPGAWWTSSSRASPPADLTPSADARLSRPGLDPGIRPWRATGRQP